MSIIKQFSEDYSIVTLYGTKEIYIENFISIIELSEVTARIRAKGEIVTIEGRELQAEFMNKDNIKINGIINSINIMGVVS